MTPTPQDPVTIDKDEYSQPNVISNKVVISGMSGLFPKSKNVKDLSDMLYNKINPIEPCKRFDYHHPELVSYAGNIPGLSYFDAQFFKVHYLLSNSMDPMGRKILEHSYQAIYDAGLNPEELSGKKVGVFIGSCFSETEKACFYAAASRTGFGIAGCSKTMFANRISYWLNAKGPSMSIDEACCSSTVALEQAYLAISRGECEAAIVGGTFLCLHPQSSIHFGRMIQLCSDGKTKSFDQNADGCAKSEAINVLFLQKASVAMRVYAELRYIKTEYRCMTPGENGPNFGFTRSLDNTLEFTKSFYENAKVSPAAVEYVEAFGCAVAEADKVELKVIEEVLCKNRKDHLLVGSVTSNIGYGEAASGISSIIKVLLGYHYGKLAANLHCKQPRQDIAAIRDGRMRIVTEHEPFRRTFAAVNGISVTGVNSHVLLHGNYKQKDLSRYKTDLPYLVNISARHEEAVVYVHQILKSNPIDAEQLALLHNIHKTNIAGHMGRGFVILKSNEEQKTTCLFEKTAYFDDMKRPLWFVFSGMGSQWAGMGTALMRIPIFAAAIERCRVALEPKGLDIVHIITSTDDTIFDNILHSFVGIAAIQIGLTDILHAIGLKPHGIIGHSVGELGCAYADGCLTAEEMILASYYRGLVSLETKFIHGSMAAVGMGYEQISKICPPEIEVACHNGPESSTISGPSDKMRAFVEELTKKKIFAREVPCSHIAYHSRYIADAGPGLLQYLKQVITDPKPRSERWISSSVPQDRWNEPIAKYCSAEYLTNNLLNPVLFEETSRLIPKNATLVELAPHGLLQAILKRSMPESCVNIALTRRKHVDNTLLLLQAIGQLYMNGHNSNLQALYPKVEMPVSSGTPFLSHFVKWAHDEIWPLAMYVTADRKPTTSCKFFVTLHDKEHSYLRGHSIGGRIAYPFAASLMLAWDTLAMITGVKKRDLSVEFQNLNFYAQPLMHDQCQLQLRVTINRGTGWFEILEDRGNFKVISGFIKTVNSNKHHTKKEDDEDKTWNNDKYMYSDDIYQLLREKNCLYSGQFQSIESIDASVSEADIVWQNNWVTFIDGLLQLNMLREPSDAQSTCIGVGRIKINVQKHKDICDANSQNKSLSFRAQFFEHSQRTKCGGVTIDNIIFKNLPLPKNKMLLKATKFVPYNQREQNVSTSLAVYLQIVAKNLNKETITVLAVRNETKKGSIFKKIQQAIKNVIGLEVIYTEIDEETVWTNTKIESIDLVLVQDLSNNKQVCQKLEQVLQRDQFVVSEEIQSRSRDTEHSSYYRIISIHHNDETELQLVRWKTNKSHIATTTVSVRSEEDYHFMISVRNNLATDHRLLVITSYPTPNGLMRLVSSWRKQATKNEVYLIAINNEDVDIFNNNLGDVELAFNVLNHGQWGGEFYFRVEDNINIGNVKLQNAQFGDYDSLYWAEAPSLTTPGVNVTVRYAGVSINDIKKANGCKPHIDNSYGQQFSGVTESGERVMGLIQSGAISSRVRAQPQLLWPVPDHWTLEEAATVPLAYMQAFYCLAIKNRLETGLRVLVHEGAEALGQAVISILLAHNCEVITTVGDKSRKDLLLYLFPELKAENIGYSNDDSFMNIVLSNSKTSGCHMVISCLKGNLRDLNMRCLRPRGTLYDITVIDDHDEYNFGMMNLSAERNYVTVDFMSIFDIKNNMEDIAVMSKLLSVGIASGYIRPITFVTFAAREVSRAFRFLELEQQFVSTLINLEDASLIQEQSRFICNIANYHLVVCGNLLFGIQLAHMLISKGVRKICMHVQEETSHLKNTIRLWRNANVEVIIFTEQLRDVKDVHLLFESVLRLGQVEGVYIIGVNDDKNIENIVNTVDSITRELCPEIRYFAVLNIGDGLVGRSVCVAREEDRLPATMLILPELKDDLNTRCDVWRSAVDAVERALRSPHTVIIAQTESELQPTILQRIATIAGISIPSDAQRNLTLGELGLNNLKDSKLYLICVALQLHYNIAFNKEQIAMLTLGQILHLEKAVTEFQYEDIKGLGAIFNHIDTDEILATTEMVFLPTLVSTGSMRGDEFNTNQKNLYIIPGMEGHHERFRKLCERLKLPAVVFQPGFDNKEETVQDIARRFAEVLLKKNEIKDTFYLLGYESGVMIALETAAILEKNGLTGVVYCLGGMPGDLQEEIQEHLKEYKTKEELCDAVVSHMSSLIVGDDSHRQDINLALSSTSTISEKIDIGVRIILGMVSHSAQYVRALIESALGRIAQMQKYTFSLQPLRSKLVVLRATKRSTTSLQEFSMQPVVEYDLQNPFSHCAADLRCATIINEYLSPDILEDFVMKNLCETYLLNADSYMSTKYNDVE